MSWLKARKAFRCQPSNGFLKIFFLELTNDSHRESYFDVRRQPEWHRSNFMIMWMYCSVSGVALSTNRRCWRWHRVATAPLKETNYTIKRNTKRRFSTRNFRSDIFFLVLMVIIQTIRFRFSLQRKWIWNVIHFAGVLFFEGRRNAIFFADKRKRSIMTSRQRTSCLDEGSLVSRHLFAFLTNIATHSSLALFTNAPVNERSFFTSLDTISGTAFVLFCRLITAE